MNDSSESLARHWPEIEIPNPQIADAAYQYEEVARLLLRQLPQHNCVLPLLTIAAFAVELFLKSLNAKTVYISLEEELGEGAYRLSAKPIAQGHRLKQLFDKLPDDIKSRLEVFCNSSAIGRRFATIGSALEQFNGMFVDSRYIFEQGKTLGNSSIEGLVDLASFFREFVDQVRSQVADG